MANLSGIGAQGTGNSYGSLVKPGCPLKVIRPSVMKGETILRILPEVRDGEILPMCSGKIADVANWSAMAIASVTTSAGLPEKQRTTLINYFETDGDQAFAAPFCAAYIRLRSMIKKGTLPPDKKRLIDPLFIDHNEGKSEIKSYALSQARDVVMLQTIVFKLNGEVLKDPAPGQITMFSAVAGKDLDRLLNECLTAGVDVFAPDTGRLIKFTPEPQRIGPALFACSLGEPLPITPDTCTSMWAPWENALVRPDFDEQLRMFVRAFGAEVAQYLFEDQYNRVFQVQTPAVQAPAAAVTASQVAAPAVSTKAPNTTTVTKATPLSFSLSQIPDLGAGGGDDDDSAAAPPAQVTPPSAASAADKAEAYRKLLADPTAQ